ncbi:CooT family nickel-binding protein [Desulfospira joergensenii]|uniref:CooT family nickel-binding protein n=1 Tax=Desulfospira joergensenii TaxID=53329 RepID=UPI0003B4ED11|nr:CooT family nickel-binding protein [Desulfospira joergensenii]
MCESNVYIKENDQETLVMENVAAITPAGENSFLLKGLLGESKEIKGIIEDINLMGHKIILRAVNNS